MKLLVAILVCLMLGGSLMLAQGGRERPRGGEPGEGRRSAQERFEALDDELKSYAAEWYLLLKNLPEGRREEQLKKLRPEPAQKGPPSPDAVEKFRAMERLMRVRWLANALFTPRRGQPDLEKELEGLTREQKIERIRAALQILVYERLVLAYLSQQDLGRFQRGTGAERENMLANMRAARAKMVERLIAALEADPKQAESAKRLRAMLKRPEALKSLYTAMSDLELSLNRSKTAIELDGDRIAKLRKLVEGRDGPGRPEPGREWGPNRRNGGPDHDDKGPPPHGERPDGDERRVRPDRGDGPPPPLPEGGVPPRSEGNKPQRPNSDGPRRPDGEMPRRNGGENRPIEGGQPGTEPPRRRSDN